VTPELVLILLSAAGAAILALTLVLRESERSVPRTAFLLGMALFAAEAVLTVLGLRHPSQTAYYWFPWRMLTLALLPGCWLLFTLTYARGRGAEFVRSWRWILGALFVLPVGLALAGWNQLDGVIPLYTEDNVLLYPLSKAGVFLQAAFLIGMILCLMNMERTLRAAKGTMRWRIKYTLIGLGLLFAVRGYGAIQGILYSFLSAQLGGLNALALLLGCALVFLSLLRAPLHSVDVYPSHGMLAGSLTLVLAGCYLLIVGVLAEVMARWPVARAFPLNSFLILLAVVGVALILLSDRLRQQTRRFVSGHFRRPHYDYRQVWTKLADRTASLTSPEELCRAVHTVISEIFDLLAVSIWLADEAGGRLVLGGSSALTPDEASRRLGAIPLTEEILRHLRAPATPVLVRDTAGEFGALVRRLGQKEFEQGGESFYLPLAAGHEVLGLMVCGDRVNGVPLTEEERQLLETIGRQISANLLAIRLAGRLAEAHKLEAFQSMSAFFVHDLKNTASTLSLMLQNLPRHFDDPDFRKDALAGIATSVEKINGLIRRLSLFRQNIEMKPVSADLNAVIRPVLEREAAANPGMVVTELAALPPVRVDAEHFQKVVVNLVLNAREASPAGTPVEVRTRRSDNWAVLSVRDRGCGMTPEFMARSLFKPFQTTKPNGIGIGMFHCKVIVEAHRGRIEVESRQGEGSTFHVWLPLQGEPG
jgi:putative PEP-CTERM system histidine kinase